MLNLDVENSVAPVTCNGPGKPVAAHPFLTPPYRGWTSIVSYFDHDSPNFVQDGLVVTATGEEARPDDSHHAPDFPAYWDPNLRQYIYYDGHNGYDYDLYYVPVYAAAPGKVIYANWEYADAPDHGYGQMVMIDHRNGYVTLYGHFSKILVHIGQKVKRGQEIGISGNTGHSTGPHLHFTVFHNCSPVDPYGWAGSGPDPLASYQGETSTYLWIRAPLVTNPAPGWPGLAMLPGYSGYRLVLLHLPPVSGGTTTFTDRLHSEARLVERELGPGVHARIDMLRGAIILESPVPPARLYAIPDIASIGSQDVASDARADLLSAVARAALLMQHRVLPLGKSRDWSGFLVEWQGRTLLVGRGKRGQAIDLRLPRGRREQVETVQANATTGAYAVDLGKLSRSARFRLRRELQSTTPRVHHMRVRRVQPVRQATVIRSRHDPGTGSSVTIIVGVVLALAAVAIAGLWRFGGLFSRARSVE